MGFRRKVYVCDCCNNEIGSIYDKQIGSFVFPGRRDTFYKIPKYYLFMNNQSLYKEKSIIICEPCMKKIHKYINEESKITFEIEIEGTHEQKLQKKSFFNRLR